MTDKLTIVKEEDEAISFPLPQGMSKSDVTNLNVDKLKESMLQSTFLLQAHLYNQGVMEADRVSKSRNFMDMIEKEIKDDFDLLPIDVKIELYKLFSGNVNSSLRFLQSLHSNTATGADIIKSLESHNNSKSKQLAKNDKSGSGKKNLESIRIKIRDAIAKKVAEDE